MGRVDENPMLEWVLVGKSTATFSQHAKRGIIMKAYFRTFGLAMGVILVTSAATLAQPSPGRAVWTKAGCTNCHGISGEGGAGGEFPAGPSLKETQLDKAALTETISCGRPGTPMPAWLDGAYTQVACFGLPLGPPTDDTATRPILTQDEIDELVAYLLADVVGK
jgi:mono/diheme cytochrome c family protein